MKSLADLPTIRELSEIQEENIAEAEKQGILPLNESEPGEGPEGAGEEDASEAEDDQEDDRSEDA